ncbi:MAG: hypothetical protein Q8P92_04505 [Candidatus Daviesbacteria bacterium]|nr:hypothetical protein [Candidatus Daviesbacteria bacterium]
MTEAPGPDIIEMQYGVAYPIWTEQEAETMVGDLENVNVFDQLSTPPERLEKNINLEGYPLRATLNYEPPQYNGHQNANIPYQDATFFEAQFLPTGEVKVKRSPLILQIYPNNRYYPEMDFSAHLSFELRFGNGEKFAGVLESEENGDCDVTMTDSIADGNVLLPSDPKLISATQIVFYK